MKESWITVSAKEEQVLFSGTEEHQYCAFPSIIPYKDTILCMFKLGDAHMRDAGSIAYLRFLRDGTVTESGVAAAPEEGKNFQNVEVLAFPDGTVRYYVDVQDIASGKTRLGMFCGNAASAADGLSFPYNPAVVTDLDGTAYGYAFDGCPVPGGYLLLAMTFPELESSVPEKTPVLLFSRDGTTWEKRLKLNEAFGGSFNESALCTIGETVYLALRGYEGTTVFAACTPEGEVSAFRRVTKETDGIDEIGRPSLFADGGRLFCLCRCYTEKGQPMELRLLELCPDTLAVRRQVLLDTGTRDGYYAEAYRDGNDFCVVTYKQHGGEEKPSIVLLRYPWDALC